ncbi:MAG: alpha/beta fold hydrolase [Thermoplasmatota archaeon]
MRGLVAALVVVIAGCAAPPPARIPGPGSIAVSSVTVVPFTVTSPDGTPLAAVAYVPHTDMAVPGGVHWPAVLFLHGWGQSKEVFEGGSMNQSANRLDEFARDGFVAVAYDARGFGASGGTTTVAGPSERMDLDAVVAAARDRFPIAAVGVTGPSYGGGQALLAWAGDSNFTAAAAQYGWDDLYGGLIPGNVPKLEWAQTLYAGGLPGGHYSPMVNRWYEDLYTRAALATDHLEMDARSVLSAGSPRPLYLCQGMGETLFPQVDALAANARHWGAPVKVTVLSGGHGSDWEQCWQQTKEWFRYYLAGRDTHVTDWPALESVDAVAPGHANFSAWPASQMEPRWLRVGASNDLASEPTTSTVTVTQAVATTPGSPAAFSDRVPAPALPDTGPGAGLSFQMSLDNAATLLGAPKLTLHVANATSPPFQVVAQLQRVAADGTRQVLGHAAFAALSVSDFEGGNATLQFSWVKAAFQRGDTLRIVVAANDPSWYMPLGSAYSATFQGKNRVDLPWLPPQLRPGESP